MSLQKAEELVALNQQQRVPTNHRRPPKNVGKKSSTLLKSKDYALRVPPPPKVPCCFILWGMLSFIATVFLFAAFYLPYWIHGTYHDAFDVSFNSFSRCNYKHLDLADGSSIIMPECSNYRADSDLLSMYWKATSSLLVIAILLCFLVDFFLLFSCCLPYSINTTSVKWLLSVQIFSLGLIISGLIVFPLGWTSVEVKDVCQISSDVLYDLGTCQLSLSAHLMAVSLILHLFCLMLGSLSVCKLRKNKSALLATDGQLYENAVIYDKY